VIKVCFLAQNKETTISKVIPRIKKMTPNRNGIWDNLVYEENPYKSDFCIILDDCYESFPTERAIYLGHHDYLTWEDKPALLKFPLNKYLGTMWWWLDLDYDTLMNLKYKEKSKNLICVVTYQEHHEIYRNRIKYVENLLQYINKFDLYGRPSNKFIENKKLKEIYKGVLGFEVKDYSTIQHTYGKEILIDYKYSLEFDLPIKNFFSERLYDSFLSWCTPLYFGECDLSKYFPKNSFVQNPLIEDVSRIVNSSLHEDNINFIAEARHLLLNKYQLWPYVHNIVNNIDTYKKEQSKCC